MRRAVARTGIVLSRSGGALPRHAPRLSAFVGGPLGGGRQWMPWIHVDDEVGALRFLLEHPQATGPFNLASPQPARNRELSAAVGRALHRPSWLPAPRVAVELLAGELAEAMFGSLRVLPARLLALGYRFRFPSLEGALDDLIR